MNKIWDILHEEKTVIFADIDGCPDKIVKRKNYE